MASPIEQICPVRPSRKKFTFSPEHGDDIVRVCGERVHGMKERDDIFPGWKRLGRTNGLQPFATSNRFTTTTQPSYLENLPPEVFHMICTKLDIQSLFNLCHTNLWARQHVVSCLQFKKVLNLATDDLRFFFQCDAARNITLPKFLDLLYEPLCACCHREVGIFIYLPNMVRYCQNCLCWRREDDRMVTVSIDSVMEECDFDAETLKRIPISQTSELYYCDMMNERGSACLQDVVDIYMELNDGYYPDGLQEETSLTATWASYPLDPQTNQKLPYYHCKGCRNATRSRFYDRNDEYGELGAVRGAQYTARTFLDHFEWCKAAQELWRDYLSALQSSNGIDNNQQ